MEDNEYTKIARELTRLADYMENRRRNTAQPTLSESMRRQLFNSFSSLNTTQEVIKFFAASLKEYPELSQEFQALGGVYNVLRRVIGQLSSILEGMEDKLDGDGQQQIWELLHSIPTLK